MEIKKAYEKLYKAPQKPQYIDFQVKATCSVHSSKEAPSYLFLKLVHPLTNKEMGTAYIYSNEWYPGRTTRTSFSHYQQVLRYCFQGLELEGKEPTLLLQVLQAVWCPPLNDETETQEFKPFFSDGKLVFLKFIIAPNYNITGAELEQAFNCPAKFFYDSFLGLQRDIRSSPSSTGFVRGNAIHKGTQYAANEWVRSQDPVKALTAYHRAVLDEWRSNFGILLRKSYTRGPDKNLRLPFEVDSLVVDRIAEKLSDTTDDQLLNECLLFSPNRGISGRADQIILHNDEPNELWEIKTGSRYFIESDYDPLTGLTHPGGVQAFAYYEVIKNILKAPPETFIEFFDADKGLADDNPEVIPLDQHAVVLRRKISLEQEPNEQYFDLLLQTRNIAYAIESGLLSGYDRYKINTFLSRRYMPALGTDFNYLSSNWFRICRYCSSNLLGLCADGKRILDPDIWLHFPQGLFEYWAWYFRQLRSELNTVKKYLHHLATIPIEQLSSQGLTIGNLKQKKFDAYRYLLTLTSPEQVFTRIREGDEVFVTPMEYRPGEIFSLEGEIVEMSAREITIKTRSTLKARSNSKKTRFRIDKVEKVLFSRWQTRSLTDFLFESMFRSGILGRRITMKELPFTTKLLLGEINQKEIQPKARPYLAKALDEDKVKAIEKALGLDPGEMMLVQGPPGTGKTRMIAQLAKEVFDEFYLLTAKANIFGDYLPKPVLILANTHRAADEVVIKLAENKALQPYIVRLESYSRDHPPLVKRFIIPNQVDFDEAFDEKADPETMVEVLHKGISLYRRAGIIVGTLGSVGHNLLKGLRFHYIIVDEAAQATEAATLGAFRHRCPSYEVKHGFPRIILVGDHQQLPPVVSEEIIAQTPDIPPVLLNAGLKPGDTLQTSQFERLFTLWGSQADNVVVLSKQYRMNETISQIIQQAFYPIVNYQPANNIIATHDLYKFYEKNGITVESINAHSKILKQIFQPEKPVVFLNTANDPTAREAIDDSDIQKESRFNIREAELIAKLMASFLGQFSDEKQLQIAEQIGVISPYRRQNNLIANELQKAGLTKAILDILRVDTVDRFQGDEREIIILSLTNSNKENRIGHLHKDWRRMNVSISRAKAKLIIIGDRDTFEHESTDPSEKTAKEIFQTVFKTIDDLVGKEKALVFPTLDLTFDDESTG
jgi:DNA polymerase III delta prime subunit